MSVNRTDITFTRIAVVAVLQTLLPRIKQIRIGPLVVGCLLFSQVDKAVHEAVGTDELVREEIHVHNGLINSIQ